MFYSCLSIHSRGLYLEGWGLPMEGGGSALGERGSAFGRWSALSSGGGGSASGYWGACIWKGDVCIKQSSTSRGLNRPLPYIHRIRSISRQYASYSNAFLFGVYHRISRYTSGATNVQLQIPFPKRHLDTAFKGLFRYITERVNPGFFILVHLCGYLSPAHPSVLSALPYSRLMGLAVSFMTYSH